MQNNNYNSLISKRSASFTTVGKFSHLFPMVFLDLGPVDTTIQASMQEPDNATIYLNPSLIQNDQDCKKHAAPT
jgi:hypothetical protein